MGLITKSDCMSATDLNHAVRPLCHVVDVCSKLHKDFHDNCLFNMSNQLASRKCFKGINISRQLVCENHSSGIESPDKATGCLEKLLRTTD